MRHWHAWRLAALAAVAPSLLLPLAPAASARKLQMSGTWEMRRGWAFLPWQWGELSFSPPRELTLGRGTPNGPVPGRGAVSATGSAPATLQIPAGRFGGAFSAATALKAYPIDFIQITTALTPSGPAVAAALAPGSGPGNFTWCPGDPVCPANGPLQSSGTPPGRIIYRAGANRFGGVMQMLLEGHLGLGFGVAPGATLPSSLVVIVSSIFPNPQFTGGAYASVVTRPPESVYVVATRPLVAPSPGGFVTAPGPHATTMFGVTSTAIGPIWSLPGSTTTATGFPFTTGTVFVQQATGGGYNTFFTLMGTDMRTALGAGNITLVAGGLTRRGSEYFGRGPSFGRIRMELSAPIPSLSPAGVAAASALVLLAVGYAQRAHPRLLLGRSERIKVD